MSIPPTMPYLVVEIDRLQVSVPAIIDDCFEFVLTHGLTKGIFRVSGSVRRMKAVSSDYPNYKSWLTEDPKPNVHDVCGIIKKYLSGYLDTMHGLFSQLLLTLLRRLFVSHRRNGSEASIDSYTSANTLFGLLLLTSVPESGPLLFDIRDPEGLLDSVAHLLVTKNVTAKNNFFMYLLYKLKQLSAHENVTSMSVDNSSIIFQPYIFNTTNVNDLHLLQGLLTFLVLHYDPLLLKYQTYISILGGLEELDCDSMSVSSSEGHAVSPATVYSESSYTQRHGTSDLAPKRKSSISQKFTGLFDSYSVPANRSKRFSLTFGSKHHSSEKVASSDNLRHSASHGAPIYTDVEQVNSKKNLKASLVKDAILTPPADDSATSAPPLAAFPQIPQSSKRPPLAQKKSNNSKRRSLIELFKSSSSINTSQKSREDLLVPSPSPSPKTPLDNEFPLFKASHAASADHLPGGKAPAEEWGPVKRNFSLRVGARR